MELIGNVKIDETAYPGKDLYSDGAIEDDLLDIVRNHTKDEYDAIITERQNWAVLYHLSSHRSNIIDWMENKKTASVLEVGSGCGAITGKLSEKYGKVTCIELSKRRSLINAYRNKEKDNIEIKLGDRKSVV